MPNRHLLPRLHPIASRLRAIALACALIWALGMPASAWAKSIKIKWKPIEGARKYELQILLDGKVAEKEVLSSPSWKGELPSGLYSYQIRGVDRFKRPGAWSSPKPLFISPKPPAASPPEGKSEITLFDPKGRTTLQWDPPKASGSALQKPSQYEVIIRDQKSGTARIEFVPIGKTALDVVGLSSGQYTYQVRPIYQLKPARTSAGNRSPASAAHQIFKGDFSAPVQFVLKREQLKAPDLIAPLGKLPTPESRQLEFKWRSTPGAVAYQLSIEAPVSKPGAPVPTPRVYQINTTRMTLPIPAAGKFTWKVRALASVDQAADPGAVGPQSRADFELEGIKSYDETSGYVALSGMIAPYKYAVSNKPEVPSNMGTLRLSGEYYFNPLWGVGVGLDFTGFMMAPCSGCSPSTFYRNTYEILAKRRMKLGGNLSTWTFAPKFGFEFRNLSLVTNSGSTLQAEAFSLIGPALGFDLRKSLSQKLSVGIKLSWYVPLMKSGLSDAQLSPTKVLNVSLGAQGFYWFGPRLGVGAGVYYDLRGVGYTSATGSSDSITMNSTNFFGTMIYSFGK